ncbi:hypothetical protein [Bacillus sp. AG4(2022)]|nr:hypothetical protein [Bacillus sp. AG4(2022)]MDT0160342.1 hypothetical protein [Bacillus sp. AG4(2022)]
MKVFMVYELFSDGGIDVLGLFSTKAKADEYVDSEKRKNRQLVIEEMEVQ